MAGRVKYALHAGGAIIADLDDRPTAQGGITAGMLNALVAMDLPGPGTVFMNQSLRYLAGTTVLEGECWTYTLLPE